MYWMEHDLNFGRKIDGLYANEFEKIFRGLHYSGMSQVGSEFRGHLPTVNSQFSDSDYFYRGRREFFHLTSIDRLFSILNARAFRMYNLDNSADEEEYGYAGEMLGLTTNRILSAKKHFFIFSCCPISELANDHVWKEYGRDYLNAAIIFTVENDPMAWDKFHMALVQYAAAEPFKLYGERVRRIEKTYNVKIDYDLSQLIGFHKTKKWAEEKEVRIATYLPFQDWEEYWSKTGMDYRQVKGRNRTTYYIDHPIWVENAPQSVTRPGRPEWDRTRILPEHYFDTRPRIKLKRILVGSRSGLTPEEFGRLRSDLIEATRSKLGYEVDVDSEMYGPN